MKFRIKLVVLFVLLCKYAVSQGNIVVFTLTEIKSNDNFMGVSIIAYIPANSTLKYSNLITLENVIDSDTIPIYFMPTSDLFGDLCNIMVVTSADSLNIRNQLITKEWLKNYAIKYWSSEEFIPNERLMLNIEIYGITECIQVNPSSRDFYLCINNIQIEKLEKSQNVFVKYIVRLDMSKVSIISVAK